MTGDLPAQAALLRDFAVKFLTAHDGETGKQIFADDYSLDISGSRLSGRDAQYLPATLAQLELFPGLCVTVHDVVLGPDALALRFTEHGRSAREERLSSWGGITVFRIEHGRLKQGWAEEDYFARKLQLRSGSVNPVLAPHPGPWDVPVELPEPATERAVRAWLAQPGSLLSPSDDISDGGPVLASLVTPDVIDLSFVFTAGARAAFHAVIDGTYCGGFGDIPDQAIGAKASLPVAGILDVEGGAVVRSQLCGDRLGLHRRLLQSLNDPGC
jgi:hypothetical protein